MAKRRAKRSRGADGRKPARLPRPLREFLETEVAGGVFLLVAVVIALVWANTPLRDAYESLWHSELAIGIASYRIAEDLRHWVNDGLMVIFFFVVGLEIKRELVRGELNSVRKAFVPGFAALGGMVVPALLYAAFNAGKAGSSGWGIPMATDIAFALGALALVGKRLPSQLRVLLLSLAIVDDIGAILVIAVFYTSSIDWNALGIAVLLVATVVAMRALKVWRTPVYVVLGAALWLAIFESGVHATIAGVIMGLLAPARPLRTEDVGSPRAEESGEIKPRIARAFRRRVDQTTPVTDRLTHLLHPYTSYVILPIFALANAGIAFSIRDLPGTITSSVAAGIIVGLVFGKLFGITLFAWLSTKFGGKLPTGVHWRHIAGMAALGGIGFTVSLFIGGLAFTNESIIDTAKIGILVGSILSAVIGLAILRTQKS